MTAEKKSRGRPAKADSLTNAQRQALYRARQRDRIAELEALAEGFFRPGVPPVIDPFEDLDRPACGTLVAGTPSVLAQEQCDDTREAAPTPAPQKSPQRPKRPPRATSRPRSSVPPTT